MLPENHAILINGPFLLIMLHKSEIPLLHTSVMSLHKSFARESTWTPNDLAYEVTIQNGDRPAVGGCP